MKILNCQFSIFNPGRTNRTPRRLTGPLSAFLALACLGLWLPACSGSKPGEAPPQAVAPAAPPQAGQPAARAPGDAAASPAPKKALATAAPRRHPFAAAIDTEARRAGLATDSGTLELKGILQSDAPTAIIQEGQKVQFAHVGDHVGGLTVAEIRDSEVVLGAGRGKRILPLYTPAVPAETPSRPKEARPR